MTRVNITVPDELIRQARVAGLNVSQVATAALKEVLDRQARNDALDRYLAGLEAELGPIPPGEQAAAAAWVDSIEPGRTGPGEAARSA